MTVLGSGKNGLGASILLGLAACLGLSGLLTEPLADPGPQIVGATLAGREKVKLSPGKFLVASRNLRDTNFAETVVLLVDYSEKGAMGLIINRRTPLRLSSVFPNFRPISADRHHVFEGGPVSRDSLLMLVRSKGHPDESLPVFEDVHVSTSVSQLESLLRDGREAAGTFRVYSGYAGWSPGQLDAEIERDDWYVLDPVTAFVFDADPDKAWRRLLPRDPTRWTHTPQIPQPQPALLPRRGEVEKA